MRAIQSGKRLYTMLALLLGFLVSVASLNVTALNYMLYLIIGYIGFIIYYKKKVAEICFAGALRLAASNCTFNNSINFY